MKYNFHIHSHHDDGQGLLEDFVKEAIKQNLKAIGFTGHSPLPFHNEWSIQKEDYPEYLAEVRRLKEQYKDLIDIYMGLEIDYIPGLSDNFKSFINGAGLDYCIGSVHLVVKPGSDECSDIWFIDGPREGYLKGIDQLFNGDARAAAEAFFEQSREMVATQRPDIIGHLDKVNMHNKGELFDPAEDWYQQAVDRLLAAVAEAGTIVELNTRGMYTGKTDSYFPAIPILHRCLEYDIPVMVNTDAHHPSQLDQHFTQGVELLNYIGYKKMTTPFFEVDIDAFLWE